MNKWRDPQCKRALLCLNGKWVTFKSDDPREERLVQLTDDYRDENGDFLTPEALAPEPEEDHLCDF